MLGAGRHLRRYFGGYTWRRPALRTGVFHLLFNLISAILGIIFAPLLVQLAWQFLPELCGSPVANAQVIFNLIGVQLSYFCQ